MELNLGPIPWQTETSQVYPAQGLEPKKLGLMVGALDLTIQPDGQTSSNLELLIQISITMAMSIRRFLSSHLPVSILLII